MPSSPEAAVLRRRSKIKESHKSESREMTYFVEGLTNVHGGESNVRRIGEYEALEDAIAACEKLIDEFLVAKMQDGMTVADLFFQYQKFGEVPFIFSDDERTINVSAFNHFKYAMLRCTAICLGTDGESADDGGASL